MLTIPKDKHEAERLLKAFMSMQNSEFGKTIIAWLETEKQKSQDKNDTQLDDAILRHTAGMNRAVAIFLERVKTSRERLTKIGDNNAKKK